MIPDTVQSEVSAVVFTDIEGCTVEECQKDKTFDYSTLFPKLDPLLLNIRGDARFQKLMERVKYEWENFEV